MPVQEKPLQYTKWWFFMKQPRVLLSAGKRWRRFSTTETQNMQRDKLKYNLRKIAKGWLGCCWNDSNYKVCVISSAPEMQPNSLPESISDFPKSYQRNLCHWNMPALSMHNQNLHQDQDISFFYNFENFETPPLKIHFDIYLFLGQSRNTSRVYGGHWTAKHNTLNVFFSEV